MERNLPVITKKVWKLVREIFFTLKNGIVKRKFLVDLNYLMMKRGRGKIAGKLSAGEYEFSCRNTPPYPLSLFSSTHKKHMIKNNNRRNNPALAHVDDYCDDDDLIIDPTVIKVLDHMLTLSAAVSPPPLELSGVEMMSPSESTQCGGEDSRVDEAADKFIRRFYNDRIREN